MARAPIHKEVYKKRVKDTLEYLKLYEEGRTPFENIDTLFIQQVLKDSIKFYYGDKESI